MAIEVPTSTEQDETPNPTTDLQVPGEPTTELAPVAEESVETAAAVVETVVEALGVAPQPTPAKVEPAPSPLPAKRKPSSHKLAKRKPARQNMQVDWDFIRRQEYDVEPTDGRLLRFTWPGGNSGPTIGYGVDVGHQTEQGMIEMGVDPQTAASFRSLYGKTGQAGKKAVEMMGSDGTMRQDEEIDILPSELTNITEASERYYIRKMPGEFTKMTGKSYYNLSPAQQTVLMSLAWNHGSLRGLPNIVRQIGDGDIKAAIDNLNTWKSTKNPELLPRRKREGALLTKEFVTAEQETAAEAKALALRTEETPQVLTPEAVEMVEKVAEETGYPVEMLQGDMELTKSLHKASQDEEIVATPVVKKAIETPQGRAVVRKNIETVKKIDKTTQEMKRINPRDGSLWQSPVVRLGRGNTATVMTTIFGLAQGSAELAGAILRGTGRSFYDLVDAMGVRDQVDWIDDKLSFIPRSTHPDQVIQEGVGFVTKPVIDVAEQIDTKDKNLAEMTASAITQMGVQVLTFMAGGAIVGGGALLGQASFEMHREIENAVKNKDISQARMDMALLIGTTGLTATEKIGLEWVMRKVPESMQNGIVKFFGGGTGEAATEFFGNIWKTAVITRLIDPEYAGSQDIRELIAAGAAGGLYAALLGKKTRQFGDPNVRPEPKTRAGKLVRSYVDTFFTPNRKKNQALLKKKLMEMRAEAKKVEADDPMVVQQITQQSLIEADIQSVRVSKTELQQWAEGQDDPLQIIEDLGIADDMETILNESETVVIDSVLFGDHMLLSDNYSDIAAHVKLHESMPSAAQEAQGYQHWADQAKAALEAEDVRVEAGIRDRLDAFLDNFAAGKEVDVEQVLHDTEDSVINVADEVIAKVQAAEDVARDVAIRGRLARISTEQLRVDEDIVALEGQIEATEAEGRSTRQMEQRLLRLESRRETLDRRQATLELPDRVASIDRTAPLAVEADPEVLEQETVEPGNAAMVAEMPDGTTQTFVNKTHMEALWDAEDAGFQMKDVNHLPKEEQTEEAMGIVRGFITTEGRFVDPDTAKEMTGHDTSEGIEDAAAATVLEAEPEGVSATSATREFGFGEGAIGLTPNQIEGINRGETPVVEMSPTEYLMLAEGMEGQEKPGSVDFAIESMLLGNTLAPPYLTLKWNVVAGKWEVEGHDGRHRMMAADTMGQQSVPVQLFLKNGNGDRITNPDEFKPGESIISQDGNPVFTRMTPSDLSPKPGDKVELTAKEVEAPTKGLTQKVASGVRRLAQRARASAKKDVKATQKLLIEMLDHTGMGAVDKASFMGTIPGMQTPAQLNRAINNLQARAARRVEKARIKDLRSQIQKVLKVTTPTTASQKRKSKNVDAETTVVFDILRADLKRDKASAMSELMVLEMEQINDQHSQEDTSPETWYRRRMRIPILAARAGSPGANSGDLQNALDMISEMAANGRRIRKTETDIMAQQAAEKRDRLLSAITTEDKAGKLWEDKNALKRAAEITEDYMIVAPTMAWRQKLTKIMTTSDKTLSDQILADHDMFNESLNHAMNLETRSNMFLDSMAEALGVKQERVIKELQKDHDTKVKLGEGQLFQFNNKKKPRTITMSRGELRQVAMEMQDPTRWQEMQDPDGDAYTFEIRAAIEAEVSNPRDQAVMDAFDQMYLEYYDDIDAVYTIINGVHLNRRNNYVPVAYMEGANDANVDDFMRNIHFRGAVDPGSLKNRTGSTRRRKRLSDFDVWRKYQSQMEYYIAYGMKTRELNLVFDSVVMAEISDIWGVKMMDQVRKNLVTFSNRGIVQSSTMDDVWLTMLRNYGVSKLALKPTIMIKQWASAAVYGDGVKGADFAEGVAKFWADPKAATDILRESPFYLMRGNNIDVDMSAINKDRSPINLIGRNPELGDMMMINIRYGDKAAITVGGYARLHAQMKAGMSKEEALDDHARVTARTQQSNYIEELSEFQSANDLLRRSLSQFRSSAAAITRPEYEAIINWKRDRISNKDLAKTMFWFHIVVPQFIQYVTNLGDWDNLDQARAAVLGPWNGAMIAGEFFLSISAVLGNLLLDEEDHFPIFSPSIKYPFDAYLQLVKTFDEADLADIWSMETFVEGNKVLDALTAGADSVLGTGSNYILHVIEAMLLFAESRSWDDKRAAIQKGAGGSKRAVQDSRERNQ